MHWREVSLILAELYYPIKLTRMKPRGPLVFFIGLFLAGSQCTAMPPRWFSVLALATAAGTWGCFCGSLLPLLQGAKAGEKREHKDTSAIVLLYNLAACGMELLPPPPISPFSSRVQKIALPPNFYPKLKARAPGGRPKVGCGCRAKELPFYVCVWDLCKSVAACYRWDGSDALGKERKGLPLNTWKPRFNMALPFGILQTNLNYFPILQSAL